MNYYLLAFNVVAWPFIHLIVSKWALSFPVSSFHADSHLYRLRKWESGGKIYEDCFKVKAWKNRLPDGAAWFSGGFAKKKVASKNRDYLNVFALETCRGEWAHWVTLGFLPIFLAVNPLWAQLVMSVYAVVFNIPCIIAQRYNRHQIQRILLKFESNE